MHDTVLSGTQRLTKYRIRCANNRHGLNFFKFRFFIPWRPILSHGVQRGVQSVVKYANAAPSVEKVLQVTK